VRSSSLRSSACETEPLSPKSDLFRLCCRSEFASATSACSIAIFCVRTTDCEPVDLRAVPLRVDLDEEVALLDEIPFLHRKLRRSRR
jgi:hypothetical protein